MHTLKGLLVKLFGREEHQLHTHQINGEPYRTHCNYRDDYYGDQKCVSRRLRHSKT